MKKRHSVRPTIGGRRDRMAPYLFISPYLISFALFFAFPAGYSLVLSFLVTKVMGLPDLSVSKIINLCSIIRLFGNPSVIRCSILVSI